MGLPRRVPEMGAEPKTPWNPSKSASARVKGALPAPTVCRYCGSDVEIVSNKVIYGREFGEWPWAYRCANRPCDSYVGMHPFTAIPLGTLADAPTREARKRAKRVFEPLWKSGRMGRKEAYAWLAQKLGIDDVDKCHIGWFDADMCEQVFRVCVEAQNGPTE